MPLKGKVAAILSDDSVVINLGSDQKVIPGMYFRAVYETGDIHDPDNVNVILGKLTYEIAKIQVTTVFEKMSVCSVPTTTSLAYSNVVVDVFGPKIRSKIGATEDRLLRDELSIKVGTVVVEAPPEPSTSTGKASLKTP